MISKFYSGALSNMHKFLRQLVMSRVVWVLSSSWPALVGISTFIKDTLHMYVFWQEIAGILFKVPSVREQFR